MSRYVSFLNDESGAAAAEYALILALVAVTVVGALTSLGIGMRNTFFNIAGHISTTAS